VIVAGTDRAHAPHGAAKVRGEDEAQGAGEDDEEAHGQGLTELVG